VGRSESADEPGKPSTFIAGLDQGVAGNVQGQIQGPSRPPPVRRIDRVRCRFVPTKTEQIDVCRYAGSVLRDLLALEGVVERSVLRSPVGVMALHGGLEAGTAELAEALGACTDVSLYVVTQPPTLWWHIPSTEHRPEASHRLSAFLAHNLLALSVHGFGRPGMESTVLLGGANRAVAADVGAALRTGGVDAVDDLARIPASLRGLHAANPVNLSGNGGVQLEIGAALRTQPAIAMLADLLAPVIAGYIDLLAGGGAGRLPPDGFDRAAPPP